MIDFSKMINAEQTTAPVNPLDIYNTLDRTAATAGPLRPAQQEALSNKWGRFLDQGLSVALQSPDSLLM